MSTQLRDGSRGQALAIEPAPDTELTLCVSLADPAAAQPLAWLRPLLTCDVAVRRLRERGLRVRYVRDGHDVRSGPDTSAQLLDSQLREATAPLGLLAPDETRAASSADEGASATLEFDAAAPVQGTRARTRCSLHVGAWSLERAGNARGSALDANALYRCYEPEALRYLALATHYRLPLTVSYGVDAGGRVICAALEDAERRVEYLHRTRERLAEVDGGRTRTRTIETSEIPEEIASFSSRIAAALDDDLNTPLALLATAELLRHVNDLAERAKGKKNAVGRNALRSAHEALDTATRALGLGAAPSADLLARIRGRRAARVGLDENEVERTIAARVEARMRRDFARADALRAALTERGIELVDGPEGTHWRIP